MLARTSLKNLHVVLSSPPLQTSALRKRLLCLHLSSFCGRPKRLLLFGDSKRLICAIASGSRKQSTMTDSSQSDDGGGSVVSEKSGGASPSKFRIYDLSDMNQPTTLCDFSKLDNNIKVSDWLPLTQDQEFKNWLKICLGLRIVLDYISPVIEEVVQRTYSNLEDLRFEQDYEPITVSELQSFRANPRQSSRISDWVREIMAMHRYDKYRGKAKNSKNVLRYSDATKWMDEQAGPWEIARYFMSRDFGLPAGTSASAFDASALLRYVDKCRVCDQLISDHELARKVAFVRNDMMHCPGYRCPQSQVDYSFRRLLDLVSDRKMIKFRDNADTVASLNGIKKANLKIVSQDAPTPEVVIEKPETPSSPVENTVKQNLTTKFSSKIRARPCHPTRSEPALLTTLKRFLSPSRALHSTKESSVDPLDLSCPSSSQSKKRKRGDLSSSEEEEQNGPLPRASTLMSSPSKRARLDVNYCSQFSDRFSCNVEQRRYKTTGASGGGRFGSSSGPSSTSSSSSGAGGGSDHIIGFYESKLIDVLKDQKCDPQMEFRTESRKRLHFAMLRFASVGCAINIHPRLSEEDAIQAAALQALKQQGVKVNRGKDACKLLDAYCREKTGSPPVYYTAPFSSRSLYLTRLQIFNSKIVNLDNKIYLQTIVSSKKDAEAEAEQIAAQMSLMDSPIAKLKNTSTNNNFKQALSETCMGQGGTVPHYRTDLYNTTVTSYLRKSLKLADNDLASSSSSSGASDAGSFFSPKPLLISDSPSSCSKLSGRGAGPSDVDMFESTSYGPMRCMEQAEESAAEIMINQIRSSAPDLQKKIDADAGAAISCKQKLDKFSKTSNWPVAYHTDKMISFQRMHDCVVVSKCLDASPAQLYVSCDGRGKSCASQARESAARKALFMLGHEVEFSNNKN